jgi:phospholipid/cholesterol/gamma-HCH transport system substrate-binding protein
MSSQKVKWSQLRVGLLGAFSLLLLGSLIFVLTTSKNLFSPRSTVYTMMESTGGLTKGSAVLLNGIPIGKINEISLSGDRTRGKAVRIEMEVQNEMLKHIPVDSQAGLSSENLLGAKLLNIRRGVSTNTMSGGGTLNSFTMPELEDIQAQATETLGVLRSILIKLDGVVAQIEGGKGSIGRLLKDEEVYTRIVSITKEVQTLAQTLNSGKGTLGKLLYDESIYNDARRTLARMDSIVAGVESGQGTAGKLLKDPAVYDEAKRSVEELRKLVSELNAGKGTAGKLLKDEALHQQLNATLKKVDTTFDNLNSGKGSLGLMMTNPQLYENLNGATYEMQGLMKDFRANPKKFLRIKLGLF